MKTKLLRGTEERLCIWCNKKFLRYIKPRKGNTRRNRVRKSNAITCSKVCSSHYKSSYQSGNNRKNYFLDNKDIYEFVRVCKVCGKKFGTDYVSSFLCYYCFCQMNVFNARGSQRKV